MSNPLPLAQIGPEEQGLPDDLTDLMRMVSVHAGLPVPLTDPHQLLGQRFLFEDICPPRTQIGGTITGFLLDFVEDGADTPQLTLFVSVPSLGGEQLHVLAYLANSNSWVAESGEKKQFGTFGFLRLL